MQLVLFAGCFCVNGFCESGSTVYTLYVATSTMFGADLWKRSFHWIIHSSLRLVMHQSVNSINHSSHPFLTANFSLNLC